MSAAGPVLIAFGANLEPLPNLWRGLQRLHAELGLSAVSTVYRTPALPDPAATGPVEVGPDYLNGAVRLATWREPTALKGVLRAIEAGLHRVRGAGRYAPRPLDLDIALMGDCVLRTDTLVVPDPDILHRPFLAIPLAELAPALRHPLVGLSLAQIADRFADRLQVDEEATACLQSLARPGFHLRTPPVG
ncbi:MAG: 2-amino-4-hydroxy-6-hydroxymethyldihydropteridine diphosphokinase [Magnetococcus sp. DMHC-8]